MYLGSNNSSTESDVNIHLAKAWTASDKLSIIWKFNLSNKTKWNIFQAMVMSCLDTLYGHQQNVWRNSKLGTMQEWYMLFWSNTPQNSRSMANCQVRQTRHVGHCWRSKDKLISEILFWILTNECTSVGWLARTYISSVQTLDIVWRICWEWWMIGMDKERECQENPCCQCNLMMMLKQHISYH